jgi:hypothetical protein
VPPLQPDETRTIYHDATDVVEGVGRYPAGSQPWLDLLVRAGGQWYGPERLEDGIQALLLPEGYRWESGGTFTTMPGGEAWWTGPGIAEQARLIGPDGSVLATLQMEVQFY